MMRFLVLLLVAYGVYRLLKAVFGFGKGMPRGPDGPDGAIIDEMVQDPFCKTYVPKREAIRKVIDGETYYFCSDACAREFEGERKTRE